METANIWTDKKIKLKINRVVKKWLKIGDIFFRDREDPYRKENRYTTRDRFFGEG